MWEFMAPNWCFGLLNRNSKEPKSGAQLTLPTAVNYVELMVRTEDGTVLVPQYDWAECFTPYKGFCHVLPFYNNCNVLPLQGANPERE